MSNRVPSSFAKTLVWVVVLSYMGFLVARSTYQNVTTNKTIATTREQITDLERQNTVLRLALLYYNSNAFKEMQARQHLGLKGKGENVVALPEATTEAEIILSNSPTEKSETPVNEPPYLAWWHLFF